MTAYLLDTNIISNATKSRPSETLLEWLGKQADSDLFISSLTVAEIHRGILALAAGRKRANLEGWFSGPEGPEALFAGRVLSFDIKAALIWGRLMARGSAIGRPPSSDDDRFIALKKLSGSAQGSAGQALGCVFRHTSSSFASSTAV